MIVKPFLLGFSKSGLMFQCEALQTIVRTQIDRGEGDYLTLTATVSPGAAIHGSAYPMISAGYSSVLVPATSILASNNKNDYENDSSRRIVTDEDEVTITLMLEVIA